MGRETRGHDAQSLFFLSGEPLLRFGGLILLDLILDLHHLHQLGDLFKLRRSSFTSSRLCFSHLCTGSAAVKHGRDIHVGRRKGSRAGQVWVPRRPHLDKSQGPPA